MSKEDSVEKKILPFLLSLKENNNRDWFAQHKTEYLEIKNYLEGFADNLIEKLSVFDPEIKGVSGKKSMYRIYRDTRFSKDKTPYKTHIGIFICRDGSHGDCSGYYLHIEPNNCFMGAGVYALSPDKIKKIRQEIYFKSEEFRKIVEEKSIVENFGKLTEDFNSKLKIPPRGYDKTFKDIDLLMYRNYFLETRFKNETVGSDIFLEFSLNKFRLLSPFNIFLNSALDF